MGLWDIRIVLEDYGEIKDRDEFREELIALFEADFPKMRFYQISPNITQHENSPYRQLELQLFEVNSMIVRNKALQKTYPKQKGGLLIALTTLKQMKQMLEEQLGIIEKED
jgi:hypothetical protein